MLTNTAPGSRISIKEGGCVSDYVSNDRRLFVSGVCEEFAQGVDGVVTVSIGKGSCSATYDACHQFLKEGSGDITVDLQDGACNKNYACKNAFKNSGSGSSIVIKEAGCVGRYSCEDFAGGVDGVVTASIGKGSCSGGNDRCYEPVRPGLIAADCAGEEACRKFLKEGSGDITVDLQDKTCYGGQACSYAFAKAGSGSSIVIKEGGCFHEFSCSYFAHRPHGVVTASIGKEACSGLKSSPLPMRYCNGLVADAEEDIIIDIQDAACSGGREACYQVGHEAVNMRSITVPVGQCSTANACNSCGYQNKAEGDLEVTTACCDVDNTSNAGFTDSFFFKKKRNRKQETLES